MEIIGKICYTIVISFVVVLFIMMLVAIALYVEIKVLIRKRNKIREQYSKEEQRLIEIQSMVEKFTALANSYISSLVMKRQELQDKRCNCSQISTSNTESQTPSG